MKKLSLTLLANAMLFLASAQLTAPASTPAKYNHYEAFNPVFYPQGSNQYRSASGEPGPQYWQNRADYKLNVNLDTITHTVSGTVEITYTNNSPDNLKFLWLSFQITS